MLMCMNELQFVCLFIYDTNGRTFIFVVPTAFPVLSIVSERRIKKIYSLKTALKIRKYLKRFESYSKNFESDLETNSESTRNSLKH